jgi:L-iditol 2-dehydrogenase
MQAGILYGREDVRVEQVAIPEVGPGEVLLKVEAALTCGTDVKVYRRGYHAKMIVPPAVFGHEVSGVVAKVGDSVQGFKPGDRVMAANSAPCDHCYFCKRGLLSLCENLLFINGAYAEYMLIRERIVRKNMLHLPDSVTFAEAALVEPLSCALKGVEDTGVRPGETVLILGAGPLGLMLARLCHLSGARTLVAGKRPARLALAEELGASAVFDVDRTPDLATAVLGMTEDRGPERVIEAVGRPEAWETAMDLVGKHGTVNLFGGCPSDSVASLPTAKMHYQELTLTASFHHTPRHVREALELVASRKFPAASLISDRRPLSSLPQVLAELAAGRDTVKTLITPGA